MKKKTYYLHTLDGKPAGFVRKVVCYGWDRMPLVSSLKQIRKEQEMSRAVRDKECPDVEFDYGYLVVYLPDPERSKG